MNAQIGFSWGTFAPEHVPSTRRTRTLGLASIVRHYNDRAVPGIGGIYYAMPLVWGLLGIALAEDLDLAQIKQMRPLPTANAVEALVMWLGLRRQGDMTRGAGQRKLANREDASFASLRRPGAYITQPLRVRTVQPLPELGLVEAPGPRFNHYRLSAVGWEILDQYDSEYRALRAWVLEEVEPLDLSRKLLALLPERQPKAAACQVFGRQIFHHGGDSARRRRDLERLGRERAMTLGDIDRCPDGLATDHFSDIRSGIAFINLRDAALGVLNAAEGVLRSREGRTGTPEECAGDACEELALLREAADQVQGLSDSSEGNSAHGFARLCLQAPAKVIHDLAERDGTVVVRQAANRLSIGTVEPPELASKSEEGEDPPPSYLPQLPRVWNYFRLLEDIGRGS